MFLREWKLTLKPQPVFWGFAVYAVFATAWSISFQAIWPWIVASPIFLIAVAGLDILATMTENSWETSAYGHTKMGHLKDVFATIDWMIVLNAILIATILTFATQTPVAQAMFGNVQPPASAPEPPQATLPEIVVPAPTGISSETPMPIPTETLASTPTETLVPTQGPDLEDLLAEEELSSGQVSVFRLPDECPDRPGARASVLECVLQEMPEICQWEPFKGPGIWDYPTVHALESLGYVVGSSAQGLMSISRQEPAANCFFGVDRTFEGNAVWFFSPDGELLRIPPE